MLGLFKRKSAVEKYIDEVSSLFTSEEKKAVLITMMTIASQDNEISVEEAEIFNVISILLKVQGKYSHESLLDDLNTKGAMYYMSKISHFNKTKKDWFIKCVIDMVYADGYLHPNEAQFIVEFLPLMNISADEFKTILNKMSSEQ
jgi:uncharacterized tellurite resistance protein B-like protein